MGELVNLRQFRRRQSRKADAAAAAENRAAFGRPKAEREATTAEVLLSQARLDAGRIEPPPPFPNPADDP